MKTVNSSISRPADGDKKITFKKDQVQVRGCFEEDDDTYDGDAEYRFDLCRRNGKWLIQSVHKFAILDDGKDRVYDFRSGKFVFFIEDLDF